MSDLPPSADPHAAHPAATSAAAEIAPSPSGGLGGVQSPGLDLDCPGDSPTPTPVGGGGRSRNGRDEPQPHPAATRQRAAESRCPSPEGEGVGASATPHNQWTREKMVMFLRELAATQSVSAAARAVGMSRTAAYNLRNRLQGQPFALGWEVALECGLHALGHAVLDRALNGEEVPHYYHGELVGTTRRYDNRLARWLLANPWKLGRHQLAREYSGQAFDALLTRITPKLFRSLQIHQVVAEHRTRAKHGCAPDWDLHQGGIIHP